MVHEWDNVLLVGNGINLLTLDNEYSWAALLRKLKERATEPDKIDLNNEFKPFTLSFEEIAFGKTPNYQESIKTLKETIQEHYSQMPSGHLHKPIMTSSFNHIMTTNYEYSLEKVLLPNFQTRLEEYSSFKEEKTSLARKHTITGKNKTVWHIHGEIDDHMYKKPEKHYSCKSILIGYEQYAYYLKQIQNYLYGDSGLTNVGIKNRLAEYSERGKFEVSSWVDFFFVSNVHILGLSFEFSEIHLWWLLNKRNEMLRCETDKAMINNHIKYYYRPLTNRENVELGDQLGDIVKCKRQKAIIDVLQSMGVECVGIQERDYEEFYRKALRRAEGNPQ